MIQKGKRVRTRSLDVRAIASPLSHLRVGVVVPKLRHSAVERNRLKRRIRELVRKHILPVRSSTDLVVRAREEAYATSFAGLRVELLEAFTRLTPTLEK